MKKTLIDTNPYLKDAKARDEAMARNVGTSSAIESISVTRDASTGKFISSKVKDGALHQAKEDPTAKQHPAPSSARSSR